MKPLSLLAFLLLAASGPLAADVLPTRGVAVPRAAEGIRGQVVEQGSGRPVAGAMVVLAGAGGRQLAAALTGPDGGFRLAVPGPGRYQLRVERVGYATIAGMEVEVAPGATVERTLEVAVRTVVLEGLSLSGRRRCQVRPGEGEATQVVWEEARKALSATAWAQEQGLFTFHVRMHDREMDPASQRIAAEQSTLSTIPGARPFASLPAADLSRNGYVRREGSETVYYAPGAGVLLSDEFLDEHCVRLVRGQGERAALVGLAFEPVEGRSLPDVAGTLWLDRATAELRELDYRYTGLEGEAARHEGVGGSQRFERLPGGAWIVRQWSIRMPVLRQQRVEVTGRGQVYEQLLALRERGGEVLRIDSRTGTVRAGAGGVALEGAVFDSTRAAPLAGARVFLSGTSHETTTGADGRFRLEGVAPGRYSLSFSHPRLDSLGYVAAPRDAQAAEGGAAVELAVPRAAAAGARGSVALEALRVTARGPEPAAASTAIRGGPAGRRRITREQIEARQAAVRTVGDLVATLPGLRVRDLYYPGTMMLKEVCIESGATPRSLRTVEVPDPRKPGEMMRVDAEPCRAVEVYVDDAPVPDGGQFVRNMALSEIESIEYLSSAEAGARFAGGAGRGVLLVYTRGNGPRAPRR